MKQRSVWLTARQLQEITGWNRNELARARRMKQVECIRVSKRSFHYLLQSIDPLFIKKATNS